MLARQSTMKTVIGYATGYFSADIASLVSAHVVSVDVSEALHQVCFSRFVALRRGLKAFEEAIGRHLLQQR